MKKILSFALAAMMALPMFASAHGPSRQKVVQKIVINASPDKVWKVVGDFAGIYKWHPAVVSQKMEGDKKRVLTISKEGGPTITEELKKLDNENMMMKYKIDTMSTVKQVEYRGKQYDVPTVPVHQYLSIIKLKPVDGGTEVTWMGKFYRVYALNYDEKEPRYPEGLGDKEGVDAITGIYKSGLENLKKMIEGS